jgi:cell cycle protein kinase DBF2
LYTRHRKPAVDENGERTSPRKPLPQLDEEFGTIF